MAQSRDVALHHNRSPRRIEFDSAGGGRTAREILPNAHDVRESPDRESAGSEFTVVPADAVTIGDRTYLSVVSVHSWASQGWPTNFTYLAWSDDGGERWHRTRARWDNRGGSLDQLWTMERHEATSMSSRVRSTAPIRVE